MVYNYSQGWLLDTSTGLYWQELPIRTNSFVPTYGAIATFSQVNQLTIDAGSAASSQAPYSEAAADLVAFFDDDQPAAVRGIGTKYFTPAIVLSDPPYDPPGSFDAWEFEYYPATSAPNWQFVSVGLADVLGPNLPCAGDPLIGCGQTIPAFVVSTAPPVPLPATAWLLLSGLGGLGLFGRKCRAYSGGNFRPGQATSSGSSEG